MNQKSFSLVCVLPVLCLTLYIGGAAVGTFTGGLWASLAIGGALLFFVGTWAAQHKCPQLDHSLIASVLFFLVLIALLNMQSTYPQISSKHLFGLATIILPLALLFSPQVWEQINSPRLFSLTAYAAIAGALALGIEFTAGAPLLHRVKGPNAALTEYNRGISYLVILSFPLLAFLWQSGRRWEAALLIIAILFPASLTESRATKMAFLFGLMTIVGTRIFPGAMRYILSGVLLALPAWPFVVTTIFNQHHDWITHLPPSWQHRVEIWDYMSYRIFEKPIWGWGFGVSHQLDFHQPHGELYQHAIVNAPHPHNVILQLWVELGLPGLAFGLFAGFALLHKVAGLAPDIRPFAFGAWVAALCISLVAYDFWTDSLLSIFAMTTLAFILLKQQKAAFAPQ